MLAQNYDKIFIMNKFLIFFIILLTLLFIWGFFVEPNLIVIKKIKVKNLGVNKIVFVSDFHISKFERYRLKKIVKLINKQNPDLVLSGGDFIKGHNGKQTLSIEKQAEELKKIKAPFITVLGNHDGWYDKYRVKKVLENNGITVLLNSNTKFKNLYISGVDDFQTGIPDIDAALKNTSSPRILLTHNPDIYYDIEDNIDLILAGHVHGGQVKIPFIGALIVPSVYGPKFAEGFINDGKNTMFITKGLGTSILPVRFLSVPEIVVIENE